MLAKTDQSVESATMTLEIQVKISPGETGTFSCTITDPVVKGPKGLDWIVIWKLFPCDGLVVTFLDPPIIFRSPLPNGVDDYHLEKLSPTHARLTFTSNVFDVNAIRYDLKLEVLDGEANQLVRSKRLIVDPTIAIVEDPIGG